MTDQRGCIEVRPRPSPCLTGPSDCPGLNVSFECHIPDLKPITAHGAEADVCYWRDRRLLTRSSQMQQHCVLVCLRGQGMDDQTSVLKSPRASLRSAVSAPSLNRPRTGAKRA